MVNELQQTENDERQRWFDEAVKEKNGVEAVKAEEPVEVKEEKIVKDVKDVKEAPVEEQPQVEDDPLSFLNDFPEDIKEKIKGKLEPIALKAKRAEVLEQQRRSEYGRVAAYQGKYEQERRKREALELRLTAPQSTQPPNRAAITPNQSSQEYLDSPEFKELKEVDPRTAKAIEDKLKQTEQALLGNVNKLIDDRLQPVQAQQQHFERLKEQEIRARELSILDNEAPNWREVVYQINPTTGQPVIQQNGKPAFSAHWMAFANSQPSNFRTAVLDPSTPEDALASFELYSRWHSDPQQPWNAQTTDYAQTNEADRIAQKRQQDLKRITPRTSRTPSVQATGDDTPDMSNVAAYDAWVKRTFSQRAKELEKRRNTY